MPQPSLLPNKAMIAGARALLFNCGGVTKSDTIYIISNPSTAHLGELLKAEASLVSQSIEHEIVEEFKIHGQEPSDTIAAKMLAASIIFCLTKMSMAHTQARLNANNKGVKYFSLPDYSDEVLASKALLVDFKKIKNASVKIAHLLSAAMEIRLITTKGTDLTLNISGRKANAAPGFCFDEVLLASPPDAETNIAPNEFLTNGIVVIDGSIPCREIGILQSPIQLKIQNGYVTEISGEKADVLKALYDAKNNSNYRIVAEFGIGLNKQATLTGSMLEDEGTLGTVHLGMGSNKTIGGINDVPFHLDHVLCEATIYLDGNILMQDGVLTRELSDLLL